MVMVCLSFISVNLLIDVLLGMHHLFLSSLQFIELIGLLKKKAVNVVTYLPDFSSDFVLVGHKTNVLQF